MALVILLLWRCSVPDTSYSGVHLAARTTVDWCCDDCPRRLYDSTFFDVIGGGLGKLGPMFC